jgi:hypothetical protein
MPFPNSKNSFLSNTIAMAQEYNKYGDCSYNTYPTDDKKYECGTGPFEGFFVSSVEFCKRVNFEYKDKKILEIIIKQERKAQQVHKVQRVIQEQLEQLVHRVYQARLDFRDLQK